MINCLFSPHSTILFVLDSHNISDIGEKENADDQNTNEQLEHKSKYVDNTNGNGTNKLHGQIHLCALNEEMEIKMSCEQCIFRLQSATACLGNVCMFLRKEIKNLLKVGELLFVQMTLSLCTFN